MEYGFKNFSYQQLTKKGEYVSRFEVADAVDGKKVEIITNNDFSHILPLDEEVRNQKLKVIKTFNEPFIAPIEQGQTVGKIEYIYDGKSIGVVELVSKEAIEKTTIAILRDKYKEIINDERFIFGVKAAGLAIVAIFILGFILRLINRKRRRRFNYYSSRKNNSRGIKYRPCM